MNERINVRRHEGTIELANLTIEPNEPTKCLSKRGILELMKGKIVQIKTEAPELKYMGGSNTF